VHHNLAGGGRAVRSAAGRRQRTHLQLPPELRVLLQHCRQEMPEESVVAPAGTHAVVLQQGSKSSTQAATSIATHRHVPSAPWAVFRGPFQDCNPS